MADITTQRMGEILRRVFELLWFEPNGLYAREIFEHIRKSLQLSDYEEGAFPFASSSPRFEVLIRVSTVPLVKAGWLVKTPKGRWFITEKGRLACKQYTDAEQFFEEAIRQYREWKAQEEKRLQLINSVSKYEAEEKSWEQISRFIQGMSHSEFRALICELLQAIGYHIIWVNPPEKEKGHIDIIASSDFVGTKQPRIIVHINHTGQVVTQEGLEAMIAILRPEENGLFISSSGFTNQVKEEALLQKHPYIRLIDLESLVELWVKNHDKLNPEAFQRLPLKAVYFLSLPE